MSEQQVLEEAIAVLRKHQETLGYSVVETAVSVLLDQLSTLETSPLIEQFESVTVLQMDLSGFTALSAAMDAEQVRDRVNALWKRLDKVVLAWGGQIEQHTGDGLIALFGVPTAHEDDAQRAVLAALDMQLELSLFNQAEAVAADTTPLTPVASPVDFQMRIGIHRGPLLWGHVGQGAVPTAVGDAIHIVNQMEKEAPVGGVLISYDVYSQVFGQFEITPAEPLWIPSRESGLPMYVVEREKPRAFNHIAYGGHGIRSGFVGRALELERLEFAWQETLDNSVMQVVTLVGEPGLGKTRLFSEFGRWLDMMPVRGCLLRGRGFRNRKDVPLTVFKELFFDYFDIHVRSTPTVIREKFSQGVGRNAGRYQISAQEQAHVLGYLLGIGFSDSPVIQNLHGDEKRLQKYGRQDMARFFSDLSTRFFPIVWVVEDAQWADAASLDMIDYLLEACYDLPILVVCLARPEFLEERPLWNGATDPMSPYLSLPLSPLSAIDSRHMIADILSDVRHIPFRLSDLAVYGAQGNPLFLEQLLHCFRDLAIIRDAESGAYVDLKKLETFAVPDSLSALFLTRFAAVPFIERKVLEAAAVAGQVFWDSAVFAAIQSELEISAIDLAEILTQLEEKEMILRRHSSLMVGSLEYQFFHDMLWQVVYQEVTRPVRKLYHGRIAAWMVERSKAQA